MYIAIKRRHADMGIFQITRGSVFYEHDEGGLEGKRERGGRRGGHMGKRETDTKG